MERTILYRGQGGQGGQGGHGEGAEGVEKAAKVEEEDLDLIIMPAESGRDAQMKNHGNFRLC